MRLHVLQRRGRVFFAYFAHVARVWRHIPPLPLVRHLFRTVPNTLSDISCPISPVSYEHSRGRDFAGGRARGALFAGCWGDEGGGVCFVFFKNLGFGSSSDKHESDGKNGV